MNQTTLLTLMLASYIAAIGGVYYKYKNASTKSISSIITSQEPFLVFAPLFQTRYFIAVCTLIMTGFTMIYEYQRCIEYMNSRMWSLFTIIILLIGIFGVIYIPEHDRTHYIFAGAAFFAIVGFMTGHTVCVGNDSIAAADIHDNLRILLYAQFLFMLVTIIGVIHDTPIFIFEALFLANFAVFYLYMHYMQYMH